MKIRLLKLFPKALMHMTMERDFTSEELVFVMEMKKNLLRNSLGFLDAKIFWEASDIGWKK